MKNAVLAAEIRRLKCAGHSWREIGRTVGIPFTTCRWLALHGAEGEPFRKAADRHCSRRVKAQKAVRAAVRDYMAKRLSLREAAKLHRVCFSAVRQAMSRKGIARRKPHQTYSSRSKTWQT